jgi:hypothetical protein
MGTADVCVSVVPNHRTRVVDDHVGGFFEDDARGRSLKQPRGLRLAGFEAPRGVAPRFEPRGHAAWNLGANFDMKSVVGVIGDDRHAETRVDDFDAARMKIEVLPEGRRRRPGGFAPHAHTSELQQTFDLAERIDPRHERREIAVGIDAHVRADDPVADRHRAGVVLARRRPNGRKPCEPVGHRVGRRARRSTRRRSKARTARRTA